MKDLKQTIVSIVPHTKNWAKTLYKPYMLTAVAVAVLATAVYAMLLPTNTSEEQAMFSFVVGDTLVQVLPAFIVSVAVSLVALVAVVVFAVKSHRAMRGVLGDFAAKNLTRQRRAVLVVELVFLGFFILVALALPVLALLLSALAANGSGMVLDEVITPKWVWLAIFFFVFMAIVVLQCLATFVRACFREVPKVEEQIDSEEKL